jgi:hypothetical protein
MKENLINFYLQWIGNSLSIKTFASNHELCEKECIDLLHLGRKYHKEKTDLRYFNKIYN